MGLHLSVYSNPDYRQCANGGISERFDQLVVVNAEGPFEPKNPEQAVLLEVGYRNSIRLVPAEKVDGVWVKRTYPNTIGPMFGANYASTSDSRFGEAIRKLTGQDFYGAVAIHDRYETPAQYDRLSR